MATQEHIPPGEAETRLQWNAALEPDLLWDGVFFFGVRSTGIYCRPLCPSRRPRRNQVRFFSVTNAAEDAGFRPCLRCKPTDVAPPGPVRLVHLVCMLMEQDTEASRTLTTVCDRIGVGPRTVQRAFQRTLDVTFQEYVGALRLQSFKALLHGGSIVTDALYQAGYGSSSQLYSDTHSLLGMTPSDYRRGGQGLSVDYALMEYGERLVAAAVTPQGVCALFLGSSALELKNALRQEFPNARVSEDSGTLLERLQAGLISLGATNQVPGLPDSAQNLALRHRILKALQPSSASVPA